MGNIKSKLHRGKEKIKNDFLFSDNDLGIFDKETLELSACQVIYVVNFNRLEMIIELNSKLIAN